MRLKPRNNNFRERIKGQLRKQNFMHHIEFSLDKIEAGKTAGEMVFQPIHYQQDGFAHGGVVATLADIVAGFAASTLVAADEHVVTGEVKISFFKKGLGDKLRARGTVIKPGRRINFCEAEVLSVIDDKETLIAKATATMITI